MQNIRKFDYMTYVILLNKCKIYTILITECTKFPQQKGAYSLYFWLHYTRDCHEKCLERQESQRLHVYICIYICVCTCVCTRAHTFLIALHTWFPRKVPGKKRIPRASCMYMYTHMCVHMCMYTCTHISTRAHQFCKILAFKPNMSLWDTFDKPENIWAIRWGYEESRNFPILWTWNEIHFCSAIGRADCCCNMVHLQAWNNYSYVVSQDVHGKKRIPKTWCFNIYIYTHTRIYNNQSCFVSQMVQWKKRIPKAWYVYRWI